MVTLVMACILAGWWVRSLDLDEYPLIWWHRVDEKSYYAVRMLNEGVRFSKFTLSEPVEAYKMYGASSFTVYYGAVVIPLTLTSAGLLLSKPRAKKIEPTVVNPTIVH